MKLDKIEFAKLLNWIGRRGLQLDSGDVLDIDNMIDIEVPAVEKQYVSFELVDELLRQMALGNKIPAIKAYRDLCHAGLKESKDAVERYWVSKPIKEEGATLGDILGTAVKGK